MGMPKRLVLVRHGESEANVIQKKVKSGELESFPEVYRKTPDREVRLSELGRQQTKKTGEYLSMEYPDGFDAIFTSDHTRAKETCALVCLAAGWENARILVDPQFGERNWGNFESRNAGERKNILELKKRDPLHTPMPDGETLLEARNRTRLLLERSSRQYSGKKVLLFTHGEYIESLWSEIEHMRTEQQVSFFKSDEGNIRNCQVIEFESNEEGKIARVRSGNPHWNISGQWRAIEKTVFSPAELLKEVELYPSFFKNEAFVRKKF